MKKLVWIFAVISGVTFAAFAMFAWNAVLWGGASGSGGPGSGANIGLGALLMFQWIFTLPALVLMERLGRNYAARNRKKTEEDGGEG